MTLANGSQALMPVYMAAVVWQGREREIRVHSAEGDVLLGMGLMQGSLITVEAVDGGQVRVEPLSG